jgi:phosphopantetheine attachment domain protein
MAKNDTAEKIIKIAEETIGAYLTKNESLAESGVDSLSLVTLIVSIEEEFGIAFTDDDLQPENLRSLESLVALTERYL